MKLLKSFQGGVHMKKTLAVILSVLMILSSFSLGIGVFAEDRQKVCTCEDCTKIENGCHCCVYCPYLDKTYLTSCVQDEKGNFVESFCCGECTGIWPCHCGHPCCDPNEDPGKGDGPIFTPSEQEDIVRIFQNIIGKIAAVFDKLFDALFEFLRLGELFPELG